MKTYRCPGCGQTMTESADGLLPCDVCAACGGVWIDHLSLEGLVRKELGSAGRDPLAALLSAADAKPTGLIVGVPSLILCTVLLRKAPRRKAKDQATLSP